VQHKGEPGVEESFWEPYIRQMPSWEQLQEYHPLAASDEIRAIFDETCIYNPQWHEAARCGNPLGGYRASLLENFEVYREKGGTALDIAIPEHWAALRWALASFLSRNFGVEGHQTMVTLADMPNTQGSQEGSPINGSWGDAHQREGWYVLKATRHIPKGVQVYLSYGQNSVGYFLRMHGFIPNWPLYDHDHYSTATCDVVFDKVNKHMATQGHVRVFQNLTKVTCKMCEEAEMNASRWKFCDANFQWPSEPAAGTTAVQTLKNQASSVPTTLSADSHALDAADAQHTPKQPAAEADSVAPAASPPEAPPTLINVLEFET